jgi:DNA-binding MarR family transcriptional regulator
MRFIVVLTLIRGSFGPLAAALRVRPRLVRIGEDPKRPREPPACLSRSYSRAAWHAVAVSQLLGFDPIEEAGRQWRKRWGPTPTAPMMAVTSVMRVQQIWLARLNDTLTPFGLTFARYEALMLLYLSRAGSLPLGKIGARLQVHPTSVTNLIDGLEKLGYVERIPHPSDRRTTLAAITERGHEIAGAATQALNDARFGTDPLRKAELDSLTRTLRQVRLGAGDFVSDAEHRVAPTEDR